MKIGVVFPTIEIGDDPGVIREFALAVIADHERATGCEPTSIGMEGRFLIAPDAEARWVKPPKSSRSRCHARVDQHHGCGTQPNRLHISRHAKSAQG